MGIRLVSELVLEKSTLPSTAGTAERSIIVRFGPAVLQHSAPLRTSTKVRGFEATLFTSGNRTFAASQKISEVGSELPFEADCTNGGNADIPVVAVGSFN